MTLPKFIICFVTVPLSYPPALYPLLILVRRSKS